MVTGDVISASTARTPGYLSCGVRPSEYLDRATATQLLRAAPARYLDEGGNWPTQDGTWSARTSECLGSDKSTALAERVLGADEAQRFLDLALRLQELKDAGVAGLHVEDQVKPNRCGHLDGKQVVDVEYAVRRVSAAVDRAKQLVDAGTRAIFPEALTSLSKYGPCAVPSASRSWPT